MVFGRKSKAANLPQPKISAPQRIPTQPNHAKPAYKPAPQPRPRSSWYSQASISGESVPLMPALMTNKKQMASDSHTSAAQDTMSPLTSGALRSFEEALLQAAREEDSTWEDEEVQSPKTSAPTTPNEYMSRQRHTAVSEYLQHRAWSPETPQHTSDSVHTPHDPRSERHATPTLAAGTVSSIFRRFSLSSSQNVSRRGSRRHSESISPITEHSYVPGSFDDKEYKNHMRSPLSMLKQSIEQNPASSQHKPQTPVPPSAVSGRVEAFPFLQPTVYSPTPVSAKLYSQLTATPYESTRQGPAPVMVTRLPEHMPKHLTADAALPKPSSEPQPSRQMSLSMPVGPSYVSHAQPAHVPARNISHRTNVSTAPPPSYHSRAPEASSYHSQALALLQPDLARRPATRRYLITKLRDPYECTDQGSWLRIGTMRGPTPTAVRNIDLVMGKAVEKGKPEKGLKEIQKLLRQERRTVIEWVEHYLSKRWGVQ